MQISIVNGPNLNLLGVREKSIYGAQSFESYFEELRKMFPSVDLQYFQSNHEGELIDYLHKVGFAHKGVVLNAGGLTHTSVALTDAIAAIETPVVEVHISNIYARESFRHHSYLTKNCVGIVSGLGLAGYKLAVQYLLENK
jgi:3-dehydroquinate dehydratase II